MEHVKFCGGGPFDIFPVVKLLQENEASFEMLCHSWERFGFNLGLDKDEIEHLREAVISGNLELRQIPLTMLRTWKGGHEDDANLSVLYEALLNINLVDLAACVKDKFGEEQDVTGGSPAPKRLKSQSEASVAPQMSVSGSSHVENHQDNVSNEVVRGENPMKNTLVLETVFDFCSVETLKNCRFVCPQWRDDSLKAWREKAVLWLSVSGSNSAFKFKRFLRLLEAEDNDASGKLSSLKKYPFQRFCFVVANHGLNVFSDEILPSITDIARYLRIDCEYGHHEIEIAELKEFLSKFLSVESLSLQLRFIEDDNFEDEDEADKFKLPKVKRLAIGQNPFTIGGNRGWGQVFKWLPNLEALSLKYEGMTLGESKCYDSLQSILQSLERIRRSGGENVMALKELKLQATPEAGANNLEHYLGIMPVIIACKFPLKKLTITFGSEMIYGLLESYKDSLQYLQIVFSSNADRLERFNLESECRARKAICMKQITEATFGNGFHTALCLLSALKLPKLEKLTFEGDNDKNEWIAEQHPGPVNFARGRFYKNLNTLELLDNYRTPSPKTIESFARMMPHLANLTIPLDKTTFQIVCKRFKGLKTLKILSPQRRHEELDDESLTGVAMKTIDGGSRPPNITDLAQLTDLDISCESQLLGNDVKFTDHAVIHGFLQLPRLFSLSIAFRQLSENVRAKLFGHVKGNVCIQEKSSDDAYVDEISDWKLYESDSDGDGEI